MPEESRKRFPIQGTSKSKGYVYLPFVPYLHNTPHEDILVSITKNGRKQWVLGLFGPADGIVNRPWAIVNLLSTGPDVLSTGPDTILEK